MVMDLDNLTKFLSVYLIAVSASLALARPCRSTHPDIQTAVAAPASLHVFPISISGPCYRTPRRGLDFADAYQPASSPSPEVDPLVADSPNASQVPPGPQPPQEAPAPSSPSQSFHKVLVVAASIIVPVCCFAGIFGCFMLKRRKMSKMIRGEDTRGSEAPISGGVTALGSGSGSDSSDCHYTTNIFTRKLPKKYSYRTLALASSNFSELNKLGEGGFGPVFKGILKEGKIEVAVKRVSKRAKEAPKQYKAEVKILTRLNHRNLVELLGWCEEEEELMLVYKYMPNGSLNSQLYNKSRLLSWDERYNIVLGLASALNYLHEECEECILHRDIKPENVLLDSSFNAKLSDFGLARLVDHDIGVKNTTFAGTMGYMAPEYILESRASKESDIYSFGVVLLEIACGQAPLARGDDHNGVATNLIDVVWDHYGRKEIIEMADKRLNGEYITEQVECVMIVGLWCSHPVYTKRPTIGQAIKVLKFDTPLPALPLSRPDLLPLLADRRLQPERIRSSSYTWNSSETKMSRSSGYATQSSLVSSSVSSSVATA